jgi:hypothetical protein
MERLTKNNNKQLFNKVINYISKKDKMPKAQVLSLIQTNNIVLWLKAA